LFLLFEEFSGVEFSLMERGGEFDVLRECF
jgi:hypothetical protein